ncbi:putative bifunctional diguanylate cyclase/phosphodiesterase [Shewanella sp.]|uniref:putative bifunctional diguanylate cyclase/phosphodiesterase n=1 Tax=Shewanella sp. TaxID=50422 RepID=UPI003F306A88
MHIGKKILVFIAGFCLPAVVLVTYGLSYWYEHRVTLLQQESSQRELANIRQQFQRDADRLTFLTQIYALPLSQLASPPPYAFESSWRDYADVVNLSGYHLRAGQLTPFYGESPPLTALQLQDIAAAVQSRRKSRFAGGYLVGGQAFVVSAVAAAAPDEYVVLVRHLAHTELLDYAQALSVTKVSMSHAVVSAGPEAEYTQAIEITGWLKDKPIYLQVRFAPGPWQEIDFFFDGVALALILIGIFIVILGYVWLRRCLLNPFKVLMQQLALVDPAATVYQPMLEAGELELGVFARRVNELLAKIYQQNEQAKITLECIAEAVIVTGVDANVIYMNPKAELLLNVSLSKGCGQSLAALLKAGEPINRAVQDCISLGDCAPRIEKIKLLVDKPRIMARSISNLRNHHGEIVGAVVVLRDITQEEVLKHQLQIRANIDAITGLLNRQAFEEQLPHFVKNAKTIAVCYLDLEQFKLINDSCGHSAGDRMLAMVAKAIQGCLGPEELLARLGGDEFGLVSRNRSALSVARLLRHISHQVSLLVLHDHHGQDSHGQYRVGLSIGVAFGRAPHIDARELLKDADIACIAAKAKGFNQIHFYDDKDKELTYQRNAPKWAVRIARALENNELILYYQTIRGLGNGAQRKRMEILLRIQEPCGRLLPPAQFIAAAERFKLMPEIDKEVIRKTFLWLSLHPQLWPDHCVSINLSGNSLGAEGMVEYIAKQQALFDIPSQCICFEITETTAIQNRHRGMEMLKQLRKLGFSFALDDFGSGFASYGYLRELPVDYVKIDGCFVKNLAVNAKDYAIVKSIQDVCRVMGIETVAEFVENQDIIDRLYSIGVNYAQGYAIGRPQPLAGYMAQYPLRESFAIPQAASA